MEQKHARWSNETIWLKLFESLFVVSDCIQIFGLTFKTSFFLIKTFFRSLLNNALNEKNFSHSFLQIILQYLEELIKRSLALTYKCNGNMSISECSLKPYQSFGFMVRVSKSDSSTNEQIAPYV